MAVGGLICVFNWIFEQYEQAEFHRGLNGDSSAAWPHNDGGSAGMIRLGLCCMFRDQPIKFVTTTATAIGRMKRPDALVKLSRLCMENADALLAALQFCAANNIGSFRINSQILPIKTHPECGYEVTDLPDSDEIIRRFKECGKFVRKHELRNGFPSSTQEARNTVSFHHTPRVKPKPSLAAPAAVFHFQKYSRHVPRACSACMFRVHVPRD